MNQLPLLILLLVALAVVIVLIIRQLRSGQGSTDAAQASAPGPHTEARHSEATKPSSRPATVAPRSQPVETWGYQLQKLDIANAAASPFDLLVIDTTKDGSDDTALVPSELAVLQRKSDGSRRIVLAYLSIGEAESYRSYWDASWKRTRPAWLLGENPDWKENYAVCFWDPGWQQIMCGSPEARLDRVIAAGFDGVYLDKCDVFDDLKRRYKSAAASRADIEGDMVQFIAHLSAYAKSLNPHFMIVMQNAEDLLERPALRAVLDGVAKEELVYGADTPEKLNSADDFDHSRSMLDLMRADGKLVLVVEYLNDAGKIRHAVETLRPLGYAIYISPKNRKLDRLNYDMMIA
jgi:cysteinyl-tRNA synthetase